MTRERLNFAISMETMEATLPEWSNLEIVSATYDYSPQNIITFFEESDQMSMDGVLQLITQSHCLDPNISGHMAFQRKSARRRNFAQIA